MTMQKLLGISLAIVMLLGSVPLGFSEPLRVQLEQGIETNQIQCDNPNHVLVQRTNGNMACVTEKMSEKLGWEIIKTDFKFVSTDENKPELTFVDVFIKSDVIEADIPLGLYSKSMEGKVIREPIQTPFSVHYIIQDSASSDPTMSTNMFSQMTASMTEIQIQQSDPLEEITLQNEKYLKYYPDYVPDGMELKFVAMLENSVRLIYAPILLVVDPYVDTENVIFDRGGIIISITDNTDRYTPEEAKAGFYKLLDWATPEGKEPIPRSMIEENDTLILVQYGERTPAMLISGQIAIGGMSVSFPSSEVYKMVENKIGIGLP